MRSALKLACHDPKCNTQAVPGGQQARAVIDGWSRRAEAIGSRRMTGAPTNLAAMLDDRFIAASSTRCPTAADAPIEEALALIVRERLTG